MDGQRERLVVGAALVRGGRVLAARRTAPPEAAGRWELPGGKVEAGETPGDALVREVAEELGCEVEVVAWLRPLTGQASGPAAGAAGATADGVAVRPGLTLRVATARLVRGEPEPGEHDLLAWVGPDELDDLDWLEPDRPFLPELRHVLLTAPVASARAVFFSDDDARAVERRLRADGYDAHVERERLAGEDDDEDHPWAVVTDAPVFVLDVLCDEHDGWLDEGLDAPDAPPAPPLDLPSAPRRIKKPQ